MHRIRALAASFVMAAGFGPLPSASAAPESPEAFGLPPIALDVASAPTLDLRLGQADDEPKDTSEPEAEDKKNADKGPFTAMDLGSVPVLHELVAFLGFAGTPQLRVFAPKARVYFDVGDDDPGEIDLFVDGGIAPAINFVEIYWANDNLFEQPGWTWGPNLGIGLSAPANDSADGTMTSTGAPVIMLSAGFQLEIPLNEKQATDYSVYLADPNAKDARIPKGALIGLEVGYAMGFSADESLRDIDDGAIYVGLTINVTF